MVVLTKPLTHKRFWEAALLLAIKASRSLKLFMWKSRLTFRVNHVFWVLKGLGPLVNHQIKDCYTWYSIIWGKCPSSTQIVAYAPLDLWKCFTTFLGTTTVDGIVAFHFKYPFLCVFGSGFNIYELVLKETIMHDIGGFGKKKKCTASIWTATYAPFEAPIPPRMAIMPL